MAKKPTPGSGGPTKPTKPTKGKLHREMIDAPLVQHWENRIDHGLVPPVLTLHGEGSTLHSSLFASVDRDFPFYAESFIKNTVPKAKDTELVAYYDTQHGFFTIRENGNYRWSAFRFENDQTTEKVINSTVTVQKLLVEYRL